MSSAGDRSATPPPLVSWGVAARNLPGEPVSGDLHLVCPTNAGMLVGVIDALGHGVEAEAAAAAAAAILTKFAHEPLPGLVQRAHQAMLGTRGVVMSLAAFNRNDRTVTWLGVGDVEGRIVFADPNMNPSRTMLVTRGGIVGAHIPALRPWVIPVSPGDLLIFNTDGIRSGYVTDVAPAGPVQPIADQILARFGKLTDDALVLVARYLGEGATPR